MNTLFGDRIGKYKSITEEGIFILGSFLIYVCKLDAGSTSTFHILVPMKKNVTPSFFLELTRKLVVCLFE